MIVAVVVVATLWLAALTVLVLALVRQVAGLQIALTQRSSDHFSVDADGPMVGLATPPALAEIISLAGLNSAISHWVVVVVSATCGNCREIIEGLDRRELDGVGSIVLIPDETAAAQELVSLARQKFEIVEQGSLAKTASSALNVHSVPFVVGLSAGAVRVKKYVRAVDDIYSVVSDVRDDGARSKQLATGKAES